MQRLLSAIILLLSLSPALRAVTLTPQDARLSVESPDGNIVVGIYIDGGRAYYDVRCSDTMVEPSALGLLADVGDFSTGLEIKGHSAAPIDTLYNMRGTKTSSVHYRANELSVDMTNAKKQPMTVTFRVSDRDVAFRYSFPKWNNEMSAIVVKGEATAFRLPEKTTTFICAQSDPMIGWMRTKPSYEETYKPDAPMTERSQYGRGYTFPCLFHVGDDGWVLVSETGTDGGYAGCHLSDYDPASGYTVAFPMRARTRASAPNLSVWRCLAARRGAPSPWVRR